MKSILFILLLINFFITTSVLSNSKIVYIDMDLVIQKSIVGKNITEQIKKINDTNLIELKKLEKEIKEEDNEINKQKNILDETQIREKINNLNLKVKKFQKMRKDNRNENNKKQVKATAQLLEQLKPILADYSASNSISLVLQKKDVIIGRNDLNITEDIIKLLDKKIKKIDIN